MVFDGSVFDVGAAPWDPAAANTQLTWTPATGSPVTLGTGASDYFLVGLDGTGPVASSPLTSKGPGQPGASALDVVVPARIVSAQALLLGTDIANLWTLRAALASAMSQEPVGSGSSLALGLLTLQRGNGLPDLEIDAMPNGAPALAMVAANGSGLATTDMEWLCPYPFWRTTTDTTVTIASPSTPTAVNNPGDALCPPLIRIYGDMTLVTVTNGTTGESFQIGGQIPSGQYVEIDTTPGQKSVELVNGGVRTNWMGNLDIASDALFQLQPGANSVSWTAGATGGSGAKNAVFVYRPRTRGI